MTDRETRHASSASLLSVKLSASSGKDFVDWFEDKTAEYQMQGYSLTDAKERAMSDWHTYEADNGVRVEAHPE